MKNITNADAIFNFPSPLTRRLRISEKKDCLKAIGRLLQERDNCPNNWKTSSDLELEEWMNKNRNH